MTQPVQAARLRGAAPIADKSPDLKGVAPVFAAGGDLEQLGETRRMALGKSIGATPLDLPETCLGNAIVSPWSNGQTEGQITRLCAPED